MSFHPVQLPNSTVPLSVNLAAAFDPEKNVSNKPIVQVSRYESLSDENILILGAGMTSYYIYYRAS